MDVLELKDFKAHGKLKINFINKNFLLYGDNGAGKSSIYEALKIVFYKNKIEPIRIATEAPEQYREKLNEFYREYNKRHSTNNFKIHINANELEDFPRDQYKVYMIDLSSTNFDRFIRLDELLDKVNFDLPHNKTFKYKKIEQKANDFLKFCREDIKIKVDKDENYIIKITDKSRKLLGEKDIKIFFNEAKLNLVIFALLFSAIEVYKNIDRKNILILDDFITSLDMSNRTFLMKYILDTFEDFQICIFTHNVYFYNLIMYLVNDIYRRSGLWQFANLYEKGNKHTSYITPSNKKKLELATLESNWNTSRNGKDIGNQIRQKFEILLYEFSKILMVGGVEESNDILEAVINNQVYLDSQGKGCCKLSSEIEEKITSLISSLARVDASTRPDKPAAKCQILEIAITQISALFESYRIHEMPQIKEIMNNLKLYRKVSMHPLSHGRFGESSFSEKEINSSIKLLKKLEQNIFDLRNARVDDA